MLKQLFSFDLSLSFSPRHTTSPIFILWHFRWHKLKFHNSQIIQSHLFTYKHYLQRALLTFSSISIFTIKWLFCYVKLRIWEIRSQSFQGFFLHINAYLFPFFAIKFGHFIEYTIVSISSKHSSLIARIGNEDVLFSRNEKKTFVHT